MIDLLDALGFGHLELGSITARPCQGNSKPRIFRLPKDEALINRMGLPNMGADAFAKHMGKLTTNIPFGVNIAKTPDFVAGKNGNINGIEDFMTSFEKLHHLGSYTLFNLRCPNSHDATLFENPEVFLPLAKEIKAMRADLKIQKPVLIKISPELDETLLKKTVDIALKYDFDGFVISNTTTRRDQLKSAQKKILNIGRGGLSGAPLLTPANQQLQKVFNIVGRRKFLIGVGGITCLEDVVSKLASGATLVQVYTGFVYNGPYFIKKLNEDLHHFCQKIGMNSYTELIGLGEGLA